MSVENKKNLNKRTAKPSPKKQRKDGRKRPPTAPGGGGGAWKKQ